jgi:hypothetical protein
MCDVNTVPDQPMHDVSLYKMPVRKCPFCPFPLRMYVNVTVRAGLKITNSCISHHDNLKLGGLSSHTLLQNINCNFHPHRFVLSSLVCIKVYKSPVEFS